MIAYIKGTVIEKSPVMVILECSNIAFSIHIPLSTYEKLPMLNNEVTLNIHFNISDGDVRLYGFKTEQEKELFRLLISVNGIGPKIALAILSSINWQSFIKHIRLEDDKALTIVPGLGKKTAQRLILELKDKIEKSDLVSSVEMISGSPLQIFNEAESALVTLGYKLSDIRLVFDEIEKSGDISSSEQIIKQVIKLIYQKKKGK